MPSPGAASTRVRRSALTAVGALLALGTVHAPAAADPLTDREAGSAQARPAVAKTALERRLRSSASASLDAAGRTEVLAQRSAVLAARADRAAARADQLYAQAMAAGSPSVLERLVDWARGAESDADLALAAMEQHRQVQERADAVTAALSAARGDVADAEATWSATVEDIAAHERRVAARAAADASIEQARFRTAYQPRNAGQDRRNRSALHAWEHYLTALAEAGVVPPAAAELRDPDDLRKPLRPLLDKAGQAVPGVAEVARPGRRPLLVLPRESVRAVSTAFSRVGRPTAGADAYACGGLARQVWAGADDPLPADSTAQWQRLRSVPRQAVQPGDLVYLGDEVLGIHRAGVYVGNGRLVLVGTRTGGAGVQPMRASDVYGVKRPSLGKPDRPTSAPVPDGEVTGCGEIAVPEARPVPAPLPPPAWTVPAFPSAPAPPTSDALPPLADAPTAPAAQLAGLLSRQTASWTSPMKPGTYQMSAHFGKEGSLWSSGRHTGQDFSAPVGTPVYAMRGGVVTVERPSWAGNLVRIDHGGGYESWYAHLSEVTVGSGQTVATGQPVGAVGSEGNSTGPHLHFEIRKDGVPVDPMSLLP